MRTVSRTLPIGSLDVADVLDVAATTTPFFPYGPVAIDAPCAHHVIALGVGLPEVTWPWCGPRW